jgi:hypothetical protein
LDKLEKELKILDVVPLKRKDGTSISAEDLINTVKNLVNNSYTEGEFISKELKILSFLIIAIMAQDTYGIEQAETIVKSDETRTFLSKLSIISFLLYKAMLQEEVSISIDIKDIAGAIVHEHNSSSP